MLWLLKRDSNGFDEAHEFVVRAPSENKAREFASKQAGDEGGQTWLSITQSTCKPLPVKGKSGVIIRHFRAG